MGTLLFNKEAWHERWIRDYESITNVYMPKEYGSGSVGAVILSFDPNPEDDEEDVNPPYKSSKKFMLPRGSAMILHKMARYCHAYVSLASEEIINPCLGDALYSNSPSSSLFYLSSVLSAAYPYKYDSSGFKIHAEIMAGYTCNDLEEDMGKDAVVCAAFFGIGVIIMDKSRQVMSIIDSNSEIISKTEESYLYILEGS